MLAAFGLFAALTFAFGQQPPAAAGGSPGGAVVAGITVHGNAATSDDEVLRLVGISVGTPFQDDTPSVVEARLTASHRFEHVQVLKRFASLADPTQILLVIVVDEGPVKLQGSGPSAQIVRAGGPHLLFLPILDYEDGYGFTYGAQFSKPNPFGPNPFGRHSRLSFPLSWGGDKRAAVELDKDLGRGPLTRVQAFASVSRRTNPFFRNDDDRVHIGVRGEREIGPAVKAGATVGWDHVSFLGSDDQFVDGGVDLVVDTRIDPMLARNAVYARAAWDHLSFSSGGAANRTSLEGRAYVGLLGQTILVLRALHDSADRPLPPYLQPLLGGMETLRGFEAGHAAGDTLAAGSAELRVPLTSPLSLGKLGVSVFMDAGKVYNAGEHFGDHLLERGFGGSVWFSAAVFRLSLAVAHGIGGDTRAHFGTTLSF
jgi:outer membrane protein assembly factor BamA